MKSDKMETIQFFQLTFQWAYDSIYKSGYGSDSVASEN